MDKIQNVAGELTSTFQAFGSIIGPYFFKISWAAILIIVGWVAGKMLKKVIRKAAKAVDLDGILRKLEADNLIEKMGYKLNSGRFLGDVVRWLVFLGFFTVALNTLELTQVTAFMAAVLGSVVNIVVAIVIFVVAVFIARFVKKLAQGTAAAMKVKSDQFIGNIAAAVVYFSAIITILGLFEVTQVILHFVSYIVVGVIFGLSLAFGLAFGLGGKERASEIISNMKK